MTKEVTDQEFRAAYENSDNKRLIQSILRKYSHIIPTDELESAGIEATWKCLQKHDSERQKFTSSLWRFVKWECQARQKKRIREHKIRSLSDSIGVHKLNTVVANSQKIKKITLAMSLIPDSLREIIEEYCISNKSFREIGEDLGLSTEAARLRYCKAVELVREICDSN